MTAVQSGSRGHQQKRALTAEMSAWAKAACRHPISSGTNMHCCCFVGLKGCRHSYVGVATLCQLVIQEETYICVPVQVIERISSALPQPSPSAAVFVGGLPTADDQKRLRR